MSKKIILVVLILVIIAIGTTVWYFLGRTSWDNIVAPIITPPNEETAGVSSGVGWSVLKNEEDAVNEAVTLMKQTLQKDPDFAFVYCASAYDEERILAQVNLLLPNTKIIGGNSGYGVMTPGGYFLDPGTAQSVGILGVSSPMITWGVGVAMIDNISSKEAAKQAVLAAIQDAGKTTAEKPELLIDVSSFNVAHEEALIGIAEAIGKEVPVFGAYAVDKGIAGNWRVFANNQSFHDGVAIVAVYTDLNIGFFREHGFEVTEKGGIVTKADGNTLIEIDGRPAAVVYNELIGGLLTAEVEDPVNASLSKIRVTSAVNPLAKIHQEPGQEPFYVPALPVKFLADRSILLDISVKEGDTLKILRGDWEILLNRLRTTPEKALEKAGMEKGDIMFALNSYCCATHYVVPETERIKSPQILKESLGIAPFLGIFSCGIDNYEPSEGANIYTSMGNSTLIFSTKK